jgi:tetratricopeptide (TPR) repeat protein
MHVHLLGPIRVVDRGHPVRLSPQQRALLAVLILAPCQPVDHEYVSRRLWPKGGHNAVTLRQCVTALRRRLPDNLPKGNEPGSIKITIARPDVDYFRFQDGVAKARSQHGAARADTLRAALAEWRGEPLGDVENASLREEKARLTQEWTKTVEDLLYVLERTDRPAFRHELRKARRHWPENPSLFAIDLQRQFADGNPGARQFYQDWVREHGRPSRPIERLYEELIRGSVPGAARPPAPRQLPAHRPNLIGRAAQFDELSKALLTDDPAASRTVAVTGMPGAGKTQLAQYWASRMADSFPNGILYADLHGFGSREAPEQPSQILARLLNDLGVEPPVPTLDGMIAAYRTALSARRALVVLDNARDAHQVRPLLPGNGPCAAIVTSRDRLEPLQVRERVREIRLEPLNHADAVALLIDDLGAARTRDAGAHLDEIATLCGRLPLALSVVAARVRTRRWEDLGDVAASLRDERTRLDALGHRSDDLNVRAALNTSHQVLSNAAADLLARLGLHPGPTIGWKAVVALCADVQRALSAADELVSASLLDDPVPDRYAFHDLVRLYASELAHTLPPTDRAEATDRIFQYLLHNTHACDRVLEPGRQLPIEEPDGLAVVAPAAVEEAMHWLDAEYATVTAAIRRAHDLGHDGHTWRLALVLVTYQWRTGRYADATQYLGHAVQAADRSAGPAIRALVRRMLGGSLRGLGDRARAKIETAQAVTLAEEGSDEAGVALGRQRLALLHREMGEPQAATEQYTLALADFRRLGVVDGEAHALAGLADVRLDVGDLTAALEFGEAALTLFETTSDYNGQASTIADLGWIHVARDDGVRAIAHFKEAAARYRQLRYSSREARTLVALADAQIAVHAVDEAREALRLARDLYDGLGDSLGTNAAEARLRALDD